MGTRSVVLSFCRSVVNGETNGCFMCVCWGSERALGVYESFLPRRVVLCTCSQPPRRWSATMLSQPAHVVACVVFLILLCRVNGTSDVGCTPGAQTSLWKAMHPLQNVYFQNEILNPLKAIDSDALSIYANSVQPEQQTHHLECVERMVKERNIDLFDTDCISPERFSKYTTDLLSLPELKTVVDFLDKDTREAYTDKGKLTAMPYFNNFGVLYYRRDLLKKYGFDPNAPRHASFSWADLERVSRKIVAGERKHNTKFYGFSWQGREYEGLICNLFEWIKSDGFGGRLIDPDNNVHLDGNNKHIFIAALERARRWIHVTSDGISSPSVLNMNEGDTEKEFANGNCLFLRAWDSMYGKIQTMATDEGVFDPKHIGFTYPPKGTSFRSSTLGGWGFAMNRMTFPKNKCREETVKRTLLWLTNETAQRTYFSRFKLNPVFNKSFVKELCKGAGPDHDIVCKLDSFVPDSPGIAKVAHRPKLRHDLYLKTSKVIQAFVWTFLKTPKSVQHNEPNEFLTTLDISNSSTMVDRLTCALQQTIKQFDAIPPSCGSSGSNESYQTKEQRWAGNMELYPGSPICANEYNFLNSDHRGLVWGSTLFICLLCIILAFWINLNKTHVVVNHSQPLFLNMVLVGVALNASTCIFMTTEEQWVCAGVDDEQCQATLDTMCRLMPFAYSYGFCITFGALLVKLWRVEKLFNNERLQALRIPVSHLLRIVAFLLVVITAGNVWWFQHGNWDEFTWHRFLLSTESSATSAFCNEHRTFCDSIKSVVSYNSLGYCGGARLVCSTDNVAISNATMSAFLGYVCFQFLFLGYSIHIGYKTRNIATDFAEGKYISIAIFNQLQLTLVAIAAFGFLRNEFDVDHIAKMVVTFLLLCSNLGTLGLIFIPKLLAFRAHNQKKRNRNMRPSVLNPLKVPLVQKSPGV